MECFAHLIKTLQWRSGGCKANYYELSEVDRGGRPRSWPHKTLALTPRHVVVRRSTETEVAWHVHELPVAHASSMGEPSKPTLTTGLYPRVRVSDERSKRWRTYRHTRRDGRTGEKLGLRY